MRPKVRNCQNYNRNEIVFTIFHTGSFQVPSEKAHSVKSVRIQSYSGPHFSVFSPNAGKMPTRITPNRDTF